MTSHCAHAIEILASTRDGNDLDPADLKLVERAVNGMLDAASGLLFQELIRNVRSGYRKPWLHGIEHMTRNLEGYVLWKGRAITHISRHATNCVHQQALIRHLADRCIMLEHKGITPTMMELEDVRLRT